MLLFWLHRLLFNILGLSDHHPGHRVLHGVQEGAHAGGRLVRHSGTLSCGAGDQDVVCQQGQPVEFEQCRTNNTTPLAQTTGSLPVGAIESWTVGCNYAADNITGQAQAVLLYGVVEGSLNTSMVALLGQYRTVDILCCISKS